MLLGLREAASTDVAVSCSGFIPAPIADFMMNVGAGGSSVSGTALE